MPNFKTADYKIHKILKIVYESLKIQHIRLCYMQVLLEGNEIQNNKSYQKSELLAKFEATIIFEHI